VLREAGADVVGIASIFTYGLSASEAKLKEHNVINHSLCTLDTLVDAAVEMGHITPEEKEKILKFRANPSDESWMK
ncbi:MAG: orotate phosphoribosyltransferase, partial [Eubacterium sp.]